MSYVNMFISIMSHPLFLVIGWGYFCYQVGKYRGCIDTLKGIEKEIEGELESRWRARRGK